MVRGLCVWHSISGRVTFITCNQCIFTGGAGMLGRVVAIEGWKAKTETAVRDV